VSRKQSAAVLLTLAVLAALLSACGGPDVSATAKCDGPPYAEGDAPDSPQASLLMVDLSSNTAAAQQLVVEAIRPVVTEAVREGGVIRLVVNGGSGRPMQVSSCLDGKTVLRTDYENPTREEGEQEAAIGAIEGNVTALLTETRVSQLGNVTNLIAQIPDQLAALEQTPTVAATGKSIRVILISDLNSRVDRRDCMSLDGLPASAAMADKIVARCIQSRLYRPLQGGTELQVVRPQLTPGDSTASRMGDFLADSLCIQLTEGSATCPSEG
jgi:hypothetical protein